MSRKTRSTFRRHSAIILPILVLYIYLLFFTGRTVTRDVLRNKHPIGISSTRNSDWQNVHHPHHNFSVYSAYSFIQEGAAPQVQVISSYRTFEEEPVKCRFYFEPDSGELPEETSVVVPGHIEIMSGWDFRFAGNVIKCPIPVETDDISNTVEHPMKKPNALSILIGEQMESSNRLNIQYQTVPLETTEEDEKDYVYQFSVCLLPLQEYNEVFHFLEWFEFQKVMGVQQFTFYDSNVGPQLKCVMKNLQSQNYYEGITVNINPWQAYPTQNFSVPRYGDGLSAAANDCLLKHKGVSKYVVMVDPDEFIMPREETGLTNYADLMAFLDSQNGAAKYGEYIFKNGFFERNREKDGHVASHCAPLKNNLFEYYACQELFMMQFGRREVFQSEDLLRTKYIMRPERVHTAGLHHSMKLELGFESKRVSSSVAYSRHYRYFSEGPRVAVDKVSTDFGVRLARNVAKSVEYHMDRCELTMAELFKQ